MSEAEPPNRRLAERRREYARGGLRRRDLAADPLAQLARWLEEALAATLPEPTAATLATASRDGVPSARVVLVKGLDDGAVRFYTNYTSRKGRELEANPRAELCLFWPELERQVRVAGTVERLPEDASTRYFAGRPRGSQIAAWCSRQSSVVASREALEAAFHEVEARFAGRPVERPAFWGGYRLDPDEVELWQGRPNRLHDRFRYRRAADGGWTLERLAP